MSSTADKAVLPGSLNANRHLDRWLRIDPSGTVGVQGRGARAHRGAGDLSQALQFNASGVRVRELPLRRSRIVAAMG